MELIKKIRILKNSTFDILGYMEVPEPENDRYGEEFCDRLTKGCIKNGFRFRCYTSSEEFDYDVIVY